jgi:hypothetical protein
MVNVVFIVPELGVMIKEAIGGVFWGVFLRFFFSLSSSALLSMASIIPKLGVLENAGGLKRKIIVKIVKNDNRFLVIFVLI